MRQLNGVYTQRFNRSHQRVGHVFQGRYRAILVQKESYLLELVRYIALNPVRARMVLTPEEWPWSSYRVATGTVSLPVWLQTASLLSAFGRNEKEAVAGYRRFVSEGTNQPSPWEQLKHQVFLGSEEFATEMQRRLPDKRDLTEIPRAQRRPLAQPLIDCGRQFSTRDAAVAAAYASGGFTVKDSAGTSATPLRGRPN